MRVAIVGAGVAGLAAAYELRQAGHDVHLFEASDHAGGHANTVTVETASGRWDVDTGFVVLNDRNYPNLDRLFDELGVATQPADMSFSVSDAGRPLRVGEPAARAVRPARPTRSTPAFTGCSPTSSASTATRAPCSGSTAKARRCATSSPSAATREYFVERLIVPQVSSIWSADPEQLWSFPASFLAAFFANHGVLQVRGRPRWRTVSGGSRRYVEAHRRHVRRPGSPAGAGASHRAPARPASTCASTTPSPASTRSCWPSTPIRRSAMLAEPSPLEREVLGAIPYQPNETVLHTDERLLPRRRAARASWNYHLAPEPRAAPRSPTT